MSSQLERYLREQSSQIITGMELSVALQKSEDALFGQIKRAVKNDLLIRVRRGLFCLGGYLVKEKINTFVLAAYIYGPSYVSFESALSYYGLIPEAVYTMTSATTSRSKDFLTPVGKFSYTHMPEKHFFCEVERVALLEKSFFIASPWRALCDYVYAYKRNWISIEPLIESLRIDVDELPLLDEKIASTLSNYYNNKRVDLFLKGVQ